VFQKTTLAQTLAKTLATALTLGLISTAASAEMGKRYDGNWEFGAFTALTVINDKVLEYCFDHKKKPGPDKCGEFRYHKQLNGQLKVKIPTGYFQFKIKKTGVDARFTNNQGERFHATMK
jgi:hypothetical protein